MCTSRTFDVLRAGTHGIIENFQKSRRLDWGLADNEKNRRVFLLARIRYVILTRLRYTHVRISGQCNRKPDEPWDTH